MPSIASAIQARTPFGDGVPPHWVPSLWIPMDREWRTFTRLVANLGLETLHLWMIGDVESRPFTERRRVLGGHGLSEAVVLRSTIERGSDRTVGDVASITTASIPLVAQLFGQPTTTGSTALLTFEADSSEMRQAVLLLDATWTASQSHGEPLTSACFSALIQLVWDSSKAVLLPFHVTETGIPGVALFGNRSVVDEAAERVATMADDEYLRQAWSNGLVVPLLGD